MNHNKIGKNDYIFLKKNQKFYITQKTVDFYQYQIDSRYGLSQCELFNEYFHEHF